MSAPTEWRASWQGGGKGNWLSLSDDAFSVHWVEASSLVSSYQAEKLRRPSERRVLVRERPRLRDRSRKDYFHDGVVKRLPARSSLRRPARNLIFSVNMDAATKRESTFTRKARWKWGAGGGGCVRKVDDWLNQTSSILTTFNKILPPWAATGSTTVVRRDTRAPTPSIRARMV